ncbi:hypothetical protein B0H11DRAFT_1816716 [Mycena galericulata]|nr:hypothetical protein B0H11DRAFT_2289471 [Mycena galericulata]KAJ7461362.1 hypothetical protein B0H11DRAFT_1816716 [Mycena galericulata]
MSSGFRHDALSFYSLPAAWLTAFFPVVLKTVAIQRTKGYNNVAPRGNIQRISGDKAIPPELAARIARMEGAHLNGYENFPLWATAVLAGNFAGVDNYTLNIISIAYVCGRILYNFIYINQSTRLHSSLRTLTWFSVSALPIYLLFAAAGKLANKSQ